MKALKALCLGQAWRLLTKSDIKVECIGIRVRRREGPFELSRTILEEISASGERIRKNDIIVLSSKYVALSQGRFVELRNVRAGTHAKKLAAKYKMTEPLAELVAGEAQQILGGTRGFALTLKGGALLVNAGVDTSNIYRGWAVLHPRDPFKAAEKIRLDILKMTGKRVGVVICDSHITPLRKGTSGLAIGVSGFEPVLDERGKTDLFGKRLKFTFRAVADDLCSTAHLVMGESNERVPVAIVRAPGLVKFTRKKARRGSMCLPPSKCLLLGSFNLSRY